MIFFLFLLFSFLFFSFLFFSFLFFLFFSFLFFFLLFFFIFLILWHTFFGTQQLFTLYHKQGSAVERHVESGEVFDLLVNKAKNQNSSQYFAGLLGDSKREKTIFEPSPHQ